MHCPSELKPSTTAAIPKRVIGYHFTLSDCLQHPTRITACQHLQLSRSFTTPTLRAKTNMIGLKNGEDYHHQNRSTLHAEKCFSFAADVIFYANHETKLPILRSESPIFFLSYMSLTLYLTLTRVPSSHTLRPMLFWPSVLQFSFPFLVISNGSLQS